MTEITGGGGDDVLVGGADSDEIRGGSGDDRITGHAGDDLIDGGDGVDTVDYSAESGDEAIYVNLTREPDWFAIDDGGRDPRAFEARDGHGFIDSLVGIENVVTGGGDDVVYGSREANRIETGDCDDILIGYGGADVLIGGNGNDIYDIGVHGGQSDPVTIIETADGGEADEVRTTLPFLVLPDFVENARGTHLVGNALDNELVGAGHANILDGGLGADRMEGSGWSYDIYYVDNVGDVIVGENYGPQGHDEVRSWLATYTLPPMIEALTGLSDAGHTLIGNELDNVITGAAAHDTLVGHAGEDTLVGHAGADVLDGGEGVDTVDYSGESGGAWTLYVNLTDRPGSTPYDRDPVPASSAVDSHGSIDTLAGIENVITGDTEDFVYGSSGANRIETGGLNDYINGGGGADILIGGSGNDIYVIGDYDSDAGPVTIVELANGGSADEVRVSIDFFVLPDNIEIAYGMHLVGNALDNELTGWGHANILDGGLGADVLRGSAYSTDIYYVDNPGDIVIERDFHSWRLHDEVRSWLSVYTLPPLVEALTGLTDDGHSLTGNDLANIITGAGGDDRLSGLSGDDLLDGRAGADVMEGGVGNDRYIVDGSDDLAVETAGGGLDSVVSSASSYTLPANVENLSYSGGGSFTGTGNAANNEIAGGAGGDTLSGGAGFDLLDGRAGADTMVGGTHNDTYSVENAGDQVIELAGGGADRVYTVLAAYTLPEEVENLNSLGQGSFAGNGNGLANQIVGSVGQDILSGAGGNDMLLGLGGNDVLGGGTGTDILTGGSGADRFLFEGSTGLGAAADRITDFISGSDKIDLSAIDANEYAPDDQAFAFIGTGAFTGNAGQLRYEQSGGNTWLSADTDGDMIADMQIVLTGTLTMAGNDFIP